MQTLTWLIVGFAAAVILPNKIGTPQLPAVKAESIATYAAGDAIQPIADNHAGFLVWHQNTDSAQRGLDLRGVQRGDSPPIRRHVCRLQV